MEARSRSVLLCVLLLAALCLAPCRAEEENSTESKAWEAVKRKGQDLLHWALTNSDPAALAEQAKEARKPAKGDDFVERQQRVAQLLHVASQQPTEAELMAEAIAVLRNDSAPAQDVQAALEALRLLVEPLDNANDVHKMGGLTPVVALLGAPSAALRTAAAYVLGTAASNNEPFLRTLMQQHPEAVPSLMRMVNDAHTARGAGGSGSTGAEGAAAEAEAEGNAALYTLAAVLRNNVGARAVFYAAAGMQSLEMLLADEGAPLRLRRKALNLMADLIQQDAASGSTHAGLDHSAAAAAMLGLLQQQGEGKGDDLDLQEKALLALVQLLQHHGAEIGGSTLEGAAATLRALGARLQALLAADSEDLFAGDVLAVARQVQELVVAEAERRKRVEL